MPEMAPMLDAMVINVPSEEEGDTVSLRDEEALIPEGLELFGDDEDDEDDAPCEAFTLNFSHSTQRLHPWLVQSWMG